MASRTSTDPLEILLEMGVDLDDLSEQDYLGALMEAVATIEFQTKGKGDDRSDVLRKEIVKVRKNRKAADPKFKARKTKISADTFKKGSAAGINIAPKSLPTSAIVPFKGSGVDQKEEKEESKNLLPEIAESVSNIADILKKQYNLKKKEGEFDRKKAQRDKRKLDKENLKKGFGGLLNTFDKVTKPVQGFFDTIFNFIKNILIGKFLMAIIGWISKPENQKKLQNIINFLGKHWKKLLSLYLVFGTGLGRFIFSFSKILITGALKLTAAIAKLLAAKKLKGFGKLAGAARLLGGPKGKLIGAAAATALTVGGTMAGINALGFSGGGSVEGYSQGGNVRMPSALKGAAIGSMFGPLGALAGAGIGHLLGRNKDEDTVSLSEPAEVQLEVPSGGEVDGPGGTDKVPAMLTAGEFVMSRGAVQKYGVKTLESMNAAGGGTNQPKMVENKVYAKGGGLVESKEKGYPTPDKNLTPVEKKSGVGSSKMSIAAGQINSEQFIAAVTKIVEDTLSRISGGSNRSGGSKGAMRSMSMNVSPTLSVKSQTISPSVTPPDTNTFDAEKISSMLSSRYGVKAQPVATSKLTGPSSTAIKRHAELMKSTDPNRIAAYDAKHGEGAYSKKLRSKLNNIYPSKPQASSKIKPTGQVVGRENLSPKAQKALARMDAQRAGTLPPDVKTSGPLLGRMVMGMMGGLSNIMSGRPSAINDPKSLVESMGGTVRDGNIGKPTAQEQKDIDALAAKKAKLAKSQRQLAAIQPPQQTPVSVISAPKKQSVDSSPSAPRGGSRTPDIDAGNGSASKRKILGIF